MAGASTLALPVFWLLGHRFSTIVHPIRHFYRGSCVARSRSIAEVMREFHMTILEEHLQGLPA